MNLKKTLETEFKKTNLRIEKMNEATFIDKDKRLVKLAFTSETPIERWYGQEKLLINNESIRLERMEGGAALLLNHDINKQIGVVEEVEIVAGQPARALVRFGEGTLATEIFNDVVAGIRKNVSVGYRIHDFAVTKVEDEDFVTITDWEPLEISIVSIPADATVGVGRSIAEIKTETSKIDFAKMEATQLKDEKARVNTILDLSKKYNNFKKTNEFITENKTVGEFKDFLLTNINNQQAQKKMENIDLTKKELKNFSLVNAINALTNPANRKLQEKAGFEFEVSRALADEMGREPQGLFIPPQTLVRALPANSLTAGTANTGGHLVPTDLLMQNFISVLMAKSVLLPLVTTLNDLVGNVDIPGFTEEIKSYWVASEGTDVKSAPVKTRKISLSPKTLGTFVPITRRLLIQTSSAIESLIQSLIIESLAHGLDDTIINGTGTGGVPLGVLSATGINVTKFAVAGKPTFKEVVEMETKINSANADSANLRYITTPAMAGTLKTTEQFATSNGVPLLQNGSMNGYGVLTTTKMATDKILLGNFNNVFLGLWSGVDLTVDDITESKSGGVNLIVLQDADLGIQHAKAFTLGAK